MLRQWIYRSSWLRRTFAVVIALASVAMLVTLTPAAVGDVTADKVFGQNDLTHKGVNITTRQGYNAPNSVAVDRSVTPNHVYVADSSNNRILGYTSAAALASGALPDLVIGQPDFLESEGNQGQTTPSATSLSGPEGLAVDTSGNLFVADHGNSRVLVYLQPFNKGMMAGLSADFVIGQGSSATNFTAQACLHAQTGLCAPSAVAVDTQGNVFVSDSQNNRVVQFPSPLPGLHNVTANAVFGQGATGTDFTSNVCADGNGGDPAPSATGMCFPIGVAVDPNGNLYVVDFENNRVLEYDDPLASMPATVTASHVFGQGTAGNDFTAHACLQTQSGVCEPHSLAFVGATHLLIGEDLNARVLDFDEASNPPANFSANIVWGNGTSNDFTTVGCNVGGLSASSICRPTGMDIDGSGNLYVSDRSDHRVLRFNNAFAPNVTANLVLGQIDFTHNDPGIINANGLDSPSQVAVDSSAIPPHVYISDASNNRVLGFQFPTPFSNGEAPTLVIGQADFLSGRCNPASATTLCQPLGLTVDGSGNLWVADRGNCRVLEYLQPFSKGMTTNIAADLAIGTANSTSFGVGGCTAGANVLNDPQDVAVDGAGNTYVSDTGNNRVLEFDAPLSTTPTANHVIGQGAAGNDFNASSCNNGGISANTLCNPEGVTTDASNNLYVADSGNNRVLEYTEATNPPANVTANLVFGQGASTNAFGTSNCGIGASGLCAPVDVAVDSTSNLFVADRNNDRVLEFDDAIAPNGVANRAFGQGATGTNFSGRICNDVGASFHSSAVSMCSPQGLAVDSVGDLFVADTSNNRVIEFDNPLAATPTATATTTATPTASSTATTTATATATATSTGGTPTATATATSTATATATSTTTTVTATPTATPTPVAVKLKIKPKSLKFPKTTVGTTSNPKKVKVFNPKGKKKHPGLPVLIEMISDAGPGVFMQTNNCPASLGAGASCSISVTFTPSAATKQTGTLTITDNGKGGMQHVPLSGTGK